jgi:CelD/BcsL family acetyltransferase involved in cellulose biosynthesis
MLQAELIKTVEGLEALREAWEILAARLEAPYGSAAWMLSWWRHMRPPDSHLRTAIVRDSGRLVAIAPFFARRIRPRLVEYRLLGAGTPRIGPLAAPGYVERAAPLIAETLASSRPVPGAIQLEGLDAGSRWPTLLAASWPSVLGAELHRGLVHRGTMLSLDAPSYEDWLRTKSRNFRSQMGKKRRRLEAAGGRIRLASRDSIEEDLDALARLHYARWADRGGSGNLDDTGERAFHDLADELLSEGRFRLMIADLDDQSIGAALFIEAGGGVAYWGGGFDAKSARFSPSMLLGLAGIEEAFNRGDSYVDFGHGEEGYKDRFTRAEHPVAYFTIYPRGRSYPLVRAYTLRRHVVLWVRAWGRAHLDQETRTRIKRLLRL